MSKHFNEYGKLCEDITDCHWQSWKPHSHRYDRKDSKIFPDILHTIGKTPMVKLNKIPQSAGIKCDMYAKLEYFNPGGSLKDRIAVRMISDAEEQGCLKPGCTIIEASSGNTGIALAMACAIKGYKCIIVMPEKMSDERVFTLNLLGAKVIRTPNEAAPYAPDGFFSVVKRLNEEIPDSVVLNQFEASGNPLAHYDGTGEEILEQLDEQVDMVVIGTGTGGTLTGISQKVKERCPNCIVVATDPEGSLLAEPELLNKTDVTFYEVEGIGYKLKPESLHRELVDRWIKTNDQVTFSMVRRLNREEGILAGGSSGSVLVGALIAAKDLKAGQKCVIVLADGIRNYMSRFVDDIWMEARHFKEIQNEHNHWWWNYTVANIGFSPAKNIELNMTCAEAMNILKSNGSERLAVQNGDGKLVGVLTLKHLTKKVVTHNFCLSNPVQNAIEKVILRQFQTAKKDTQLGWAARILEKDEFVAVVDSSDHCIGFITHLDLLSFIAEGASENGHVLNAV